jgi:signal transduction histidine kinase/putative methionine-R-sulfoxide reductase with GAF domain
MTEPDTGFGALYQHTSDPVLILDQERDLIVGCNPALLRLLGSTATAIKELPSSKLIAFSETISEPEARLLNGHITRADGNQISVGIRKSPIEWKGERAWLLIVYPEGTTSSFCDDGESFKILREAADQLEVINRVVAAVNSSTSIEQVFELASAQMQNLISFDRASIALVDEVNQSLRVFAVSGKQPGSLALGSTGPLKGSVTEMALREKHSIVIPELADETRFNAYSDLSDEGFRSAICCPLFANDRAIGSLNLTCREPNAYELKHQVALGRLAPPMAMAIEKVLLLQQAESRSSEMESAARREQLAGIIGRQLTGSLDPTLIMQEAVDALGEAVNVPRAHVSLLDADDNYVFVRYEFRANKAIPSLRGHRLAFGQSSFAASALFAEDCVSLELTEDIYEDELLDLYWRMGARTIMAAPLTVSGHRRGLIELHDMERGRRWSQDELKLVRAVAAEISVALTNAELYEASRSRSEQFEGLYRISRVFSTLRDTSDIYSKLTRAIAELVGGEMCLIATYDRKKNEMRAESPAFNIGPELVNQFKFTLNTNNETTLAHRSGRPFYSNDPWNDERFTRHFVQSYGIRSVLGLPMRIKGELVGFIYVANKPGGFGPQDVRMLEIFTAQATETVANARLFTTIQAQAEREAVVNRLLLSIQQMSDAREAVEMVLERVAGVLDVDRSTAVLFEDEEREEFRGEWCAEGVAPVGDDLEVRERSPIPHWLRSHRQPLVVSDVRGHALARGFEPLIERMSLKSIVAVPIMYQGKVVGALSAHQTRFVREWAEDDLDLLTAVATHVGALLENVHLITELRQANRLKDEFLATLSHELRTPLTAIRGWVELLAENRVINDDAEVREGVEVIKNSAVSLSQLISDLLDLSRIQRRALKLERSMTSINAAILESVQIVRQSAEQRSIDLHIELSENLPDSFVDGRRIQQVIWNLLTNSIKFTPAGGRVMVRTKLIDHTGLLRANGDELRWIVVEVEDTGEGIPPGFLPYVWDRFRQADASSTRRHSGLGIGLTLVKELVEAHGGSVDVQSDGDGALFSVQLPVNNSDSRPFLSALDTGGTKYGG